MRWIPRSRRWRIALVVVGLLGAAYVLADVTLDRWLRGVVEARINRTLRGYTAQLNALDFHPFGLSIDLERLTLVQDAHPVPPVLEIPSFAFSIQWRALIYGRLVADSEIENPVLHANLEQLNEENQDETPFDERGWQDALEAIYPLKINEFRVLNATVVYQNLSDDRPLQASNVNLLARNVRNIRSKDREYPSTIDLDGTMFDAGRVEIHGNADFLAKPQPGFKASLGLERVDLTYFDPLLRNYSISVKQGLLTANGSFESGPNVQIVDLDSVSLIDATIDYEHGSVPVEQVAKAARKIEDTARQAMNDPEQLFRIRHLEIDNGTIGLVNHLAKPAYRLYADHARFELRNLSSRVEDGVAHASLTGTLMGTGQVNAAASFFPEGKNANFEAELEIAETQMQPMNDFLRAHANFDVVEGIFSLYARVKVKDGMIDGYVKPLFRDLDVYNRAQDKKKNVFRKMYEGFVGGVANLLENQKRDEVATVASISGPVDDPNSNALKIIGKLIQNAFFKAILPGFQEEAGRHPAKRRDKQAS